MASRSQKECDKPLKTLPFKNTERKRRTLRRGNRQ